PTRYCRVSGKLVLRISAVDTVGVTSRKDAGAVQAGQRLQFAKGGLPTRTRMLFHNSTERWRIHLLLLAPTRTGLLRSLLDMHFEELDGALRAPQSTVLIHPTMSGMSSPPSSG
ncbi:MAG TPA: hypothetical protein VMW69_11975, partial [Spirochaetia bacterium]|nr:hypothetical protein [Spirochaetia bacterium]